MKTMQKYAGVLLSRQPLRPTGRTEWVKQAVRTVDWLLQQQYGLNSSVGMQTWELLTAMASLRQIPLRVFLPMICPDDLISTSEQITTQFALDPTLTEFVRVTVPNKHNDADLMQQRDRMVVERSDLIIPISIRSNGNMASLLSESEAIGRQINNDFRISYHSRKQQLSIEIDSSALNPEIIAVENQYVIHWTKATNIAWPDEHLVEFYEAVIASPVWPRSGFHALQHILYTGRIIASSRRMPGGMACISFSALPPREVVVLMKWRARFRQMSFEPYGIGVRKEYAEDLGIVPVCYFGKGERPPTDNDLQWRWQSKGQITDWRQEREHRYKGDLLLTSLPPDAITVFCHTSDEAALLRERFGLQVISFLA